jgi:DNA-binding transcriptional LysR family regulator
MAQKQTRLYWDDLRVALALSRAGSVRAAARALRVSHSTVLRRMQELESAAGVRLFERQELTTAGQDVVDTARDLEDVVTALERRVEGRDLRLSGPIRVTLPDPLLPSLLPIFKRFGEKYPEIETSPSPSASSTPISRTGRRTWRCASPPRRRPTWSAAAWPTWRARSTAARSISKAG